MSPILHRATAILTLAFLAGLSSCMLPSTDLGKGETNGPPRLQEGQARLVFRVDTPPVQARALADAGYLTLEMRSVADGTLKADDALREADGTYLVDVAGLVAGDWRLKVRLYADIDSPILLYYADVTHYVGLGVPTSVSLRVYEPSSLAGGTISLADKVEYLEVEGRGVPWGTSLNPNEPRATQTLAPGETVQLHAIPMSADRPATDAGVTYLSDDTDVVEITATGRLKARGLGQTTIHVTTVEGRKTASIPVKVEETIVGVWQSGAPLSRILRVERTAQGLWAHLLTNLEPTGPAPKYQRGRVTKQLNGTYSVVLDSLLAFPLVGANPDRTQRIFVQQEMTVAFTFSELPDGTLTEVLDGPRAMAQSAATYTRLTDYVPVNRLDNLDPTPLGEPKTNDGWVLDPSRWNIENDVAGAPETLSQLYWWVEDESVATADLRTGAVTLLVPGTTKLRALSLDNPDLTALSWDLESFEVAPSLALANLKVTVLGGYSDSGNPGEYHQVNLEVQVPFAPGLYGQLLIERWNGSAWVAVNSGTDVSPIAQNDWFGNYFAVTPSTEQKFRVITKASTTTGLLYDSAPSPEIVAMAPDVNGNPVPWPGTNAVPGGFGDTVYFTDSATGQSSYLPSYYDGSGTYLSRWFTSTDGTTWDSDLMYSLRWGTQTWWIYSDDTDGVSLGTYVVGRDHLGAALTAPLWLDGLTRVHSLGSVQADGTVVLLGSNSSTGTLQWNSTSELFEVVPE